MLAVLKEHRESWDEFLNRLARRERDVEKLGGFADEGIVDHMAETDEDLSRSLEGNSHSALMGWARSSRW